MAESPTSSFNIKEAEHIIDLVLLKAKPASELLQLPLQENQFRYYKLILDALLQSTVSYKIAFEEALLNSFTCSRLLYCGFYLEFNLNYVYQLVEAIRLLNVIDLLRWHYVLQYFIRKKEVHSHAVVLVFKQASSFLPTLISLTDPDVLASELAILNVSYNANK